MEDAELDLGPQARTSSGGSHHSIRITRHSHISSKQRPTFALISTIVQTFGGFSQMPESMYMATHSSFFAMVGVAEQLGRLCNALGSVLGVFEMIRWLLPPPYARSPSPNPNAQKTSETPLIIILLALCSIPFVMHRLIRSHPLAPRMSMGLIALAFEGKVQNPLAEAYDPVQWKSCCQHP
ncbi:Peroxin 13, N-terminal region-domain-containing protein [Hysterangium stoloniferum]|nr:Peroxin 13, N-terminal region-domain-containing protein [Hysterangium stoloniferum]